jgi:hypothetical protein
MEESVREQVRERALNRCEYCRLRQESGASIRFHIEHVRPRQHGGSNDLDNLALACPNCNWNKGPNMSAVDPVTDLVLPLFSPRRDVWRDHFARSGLEIVGLTPTGRATVQLLKFNEPERIDVRRNFDIQGDLEFGD